MSFAENPYQASWGEFAANAAADERATFIRKTYTHLAGAVLAFIGLEAILLQAPFAPDLVNLMLGGRYSWLIVMVLFMGVSFLSESWARSATSVRTQYMGLGLYVVAEAIIILPMLLIADRVQPGIIGNAALITTVMFGALTLVAFVTRFDFSFLRGALMIGGLAATGIIAWAVITGGSGMLGIPFTIALIGLACGYILYDTSNVMHHYRIGQHVAAALALFASVALLFWYVLRLLMQLNRR